MVSSVTRCKACHGRKTIPKIGGMGMKDCPACMGVGAVKEPEKPKEEIIIPSSPTVFFNGVETLAKDVPGDAVIKAPERFSNSASPKKAPQPEVKKEVHKHGHSVDKRKKKN